MARITNFFWNSLLKTFFFAGVLAVYFSCNAVLCRVGQHFSGEAQIIHVHVISESRADPMQCGTAPHAFLLHFFFSPLSCPKRWEAKRTSLMDFTSSRAAVFASASSRRKLCNTCWFCWLFSNLFSWHGIRVPLWHCELLNQDVHLPQMLTHYVP